MLSNVLVVIMRLQVIVATVKNPTPVASLLQKCAASNDLDSHCSQERDRQTDKDESIRRFPLTPELSEMDFNIFKYGSYRSFPCVVRFTYFRVEGIHCGLVP